MIIAPDGSILNPDLSVAMGADRDFVSSLTGRGSSGIALGDLPQNIVKQIQQRAPDAEIQNIGKEKRGAQEVYVVSFKDPKRPPLEIVAETAIPAPPPTEGPPREY